MFCHKGVWTRRYDESWGCVCVYATFFALARQSSPWLQGIERHCAIGGKLRNPLIDNVRHQRPRVSAQCGALSLERSDGPR